MALEALPNEILTLVYHDLASKTITHSQPYRRDLCSISLTCRRLRESVCPILFKNVKLTLRWHGDAFVEPALYRLRQKSPQLIQHVKCVEIGVHKSSSHLRHNDIKAFTFPESENWINPSSEAVTGRHESAFIADIRIQAEGFARKLHSYLMEDLAAPLERDSSAEKIIYETLSQISIDCKSVFQRARGISPRRRMRSTHRLTGEQPGNRRLYTDHNKRETCQLLLESLTIVLLCIPPGIDTLIMSKDTSIDFREGHARQSAFALCVTRLATLVLRKSLSNLTCDLFTGLHNPDVPRWELLCNLMGDPFPHDQSSDPAKAMTVTDKTQSIKNLTLSSRTETYPLYNKINTLSKPFLRDWTQLSGSVTSLDLRTMEITDSALVWFVKAFELLERLRMDSIILDTETRCSNQPELCWLSTAIAIRQAFPYSHITLSNLYVKCKVGRLTERCVDWLLREAIPYGKIVDEKCQADLFSSFPRKFQRQGDMDDKTEFLCSNHV